MPPHSAMEKDPGAAALKVLHVIDDLGLGGAQRQLVEFLKNAPKESIRLEVISLSVLKNDYVQAVKETGVPLLQIPQSGKWSWPAFNRLRAEIRKSQPDIVQTWLFTADLYGRIAAKLEKVPFIASTIRSIDADKPFHYVVIDRILKHITNAYIANANANAEVYARREGLDRKRIKTIYNGLDLSLFSPGPVENFRAEWGIEQGAFLFGIVGRLQPVKDHETFLRAASLTAKRFPKARFAAIGSGPLQEDLVKLAGTLGITDRVRFIPSQKDVARVFASLDAAVVSSTYEGCSNVIVEAMAMAKPVLATRVGGNPELVAEGVTGYLVPVRNPAALSEAMERLLANPETVKAMGEAARAEAEKRFSLERMVSETMQFYKEHGAAKKRHPAGASL